MSEIIEIYRDELTEQGLAELREKYPSTLVMDMTDDDDFKKARKIRTERNKLVEAINRRRIDTTNELKSVGDKLIEQVNEIYGVVVKPFEIEDQRKRDEAERKRKEEERIVNESREQIRRLEGFVSSARTADSASISGMIDAVNNIDPSEFHKDLIHEALETKERVLAQLTDMLSAASQREVVEKENAELKARLAKLEATEGEREKPEPETNNNEEADAPENEAVLTRVLSVKVKSTGSRFSDIMREVKAVSGVVAVRVDNTE